MSTFILPQIDGNFSLLSSESTISQNLDDLYHHGLKIPVHVSHFRAPRSQNIQLGSNKSNITTIRRNNKHLEATNLPSIMSLNPRSLYNKQSSFKTLIEQTDTDVCFVSETWERSHSKSGKLLSEVLDIDGYQWVNNIVQRNARGGKPAILVNTNEYFITKLCPDVITVPVGVEAVWALLTPKRRHSNTKIKHIVVASLYYSSNFTRKDAFLDHISEAFNLVCAKYGSDIPVILGGDFNRLNIKPILNLSPDLKQTVTVVTRRNPDAILDLIITNIHGLYQSPTTLAPLENDDDQPGTSSDHLIVTMKPITSSEATEKTKYKVFKYRPFPDSGMRLMGQWIQSETWNDIYTLTCPNKKAEKFEEKILEKVNQFFPEKRIKVNCNDKPWVDSVLLKLDRLRKREYNKRKKSPKWVKLTEIFNKRAKVLKEKYYENRVQELKSSNVSQWYSKVKRMSSIDQTKDDFVEVEELVDLPDQAQAEVIADSFAKISNLYKPLDLETIQVCQSDDSKPLPLFEPYQIYQKIKKMKKKSSTIFNDIPWKIILEFAVEISEPLSNIFNSASLAGVWPSLWKQEIVTPIPKTFPPKSTDDLRKIAGTKNLSKIFEALLSESIIADIHSSIDIAQYGNQKGLSTAHYLVNLVNRILTILDTNNSAEKYAVIAHLIDWSKAFDRVDPTIGMNAFISNGLRPSLIPILGSFFQDRKMIVKWHDCMSAPRNLPGGGPQGSTFGSLQYNVSSNDNAIHVPVEMKFKFVDDLSTLEKLNLILAGLSSYNFKNHVASDVGVNQSYISSENISSQSYLSTIEAWTIGNKSKLNVDKSKIMIFNFNESMQFATRLYLENTLLETINETKLLGTILTTNLKWNKNTDMIVVIAV